MRLPRPALPRLLALGAVTLAVAALHLWLLRGERPAPRAGTKTAAVLARPMPVPAEPAPAPAPAPHRRMDLAPVQAAAAPAGRPKTATLPPAGPQVAPAALGTEHAWLPTRLPPAAVLVYRAHIGQRQAEAVLHWTPAGDRYQLSLSAPGVLQQRSEGALDAFGLAPERFVEQRLQRSERALTMQRVPGAERVVYSSRDGAGPLPPGLQDRLSWLVQLLSWLSAHPAPSSRQWTLQVAAPGGDQQRWAFEPVPDSIGLHFRHRPQQPFDNLVDLWLDDRPPHWPLRLVIGSARGEPLVLERPPEGAVVPGGDSTSSPSAPK